MKKVSILIIIFIAFCVVMSAQKVTVYPNNYLVKTGDLAPDFVIKEAGGRSYKLSDLRGKVVMLQFTASWCSVCRTEMPFIEKEIWQEKKGASLIVLGIDRDEPEEKVLKFKKDIGVTYPLALDPGADIFGLFAEKAAGVTRNVIIDKTGRIIFLTRLYERKEFEEMKKVISEELAAK
jgi:peroxiredoxin